MKQEAILLGAGTNYPLKGMLTLPDGEGPFPAVVFVHGSGSSNMDEKVGKLTPFKDLAEGLARHGVASLRYDKRTFAHGLKCLRIKGLTVKEETIEDAVLAADLLRADPRIAKEQIFIVGHSMGAMLAPRIDAEGGNFRGLVLMAGTLRSLEEVMLDQLAQAREMANPLLRWIVSAQLKKLTPMFAALDRMSEEEAKTKKIGGGITLYYFKDLRAHPGEDYLRESGKPVLILQGAEDVQVSVEKDLATYRRALQGRDNVAYKVYEGLNHAFVPSIYGSILKVKQEFGVERHIGDGVIADIAAWVKAHG